MYGMYLFVFSVASQARSCGGRATLPPLAVHFLIILLPLIQTFLLAKAFFFMVYIYNTYHC